MIALAQGSCKENTLINSKVSPSSNAIGVYSVSLPIITHSYYDDTAITSTNISGIAVYHGVGSFVDPYFGTLTGATYFQVLPLDYSATFYDNNTIDSAVLVLPYSGFTYGDTTQSTGGNITQTYQVFYMTDSIAPTSTYYSYSSKPIEATYPLSDPTTVNVYHLKDSLGLNVLPQNYPGLRIKLKLSTLLGHLLPAQQSLTTTTPSATFLDAFKGICVKTADSRYPSNAIPYFQLDGNTVYTQAGILVYYHANTDPTKALIEPYSFSQASCATFNSVKRSYGHYPVNSLFSSTAANDQVIALQNQPGASIDIVIPGIKNLPAGVINKAEIQLTLLPAYNSIYSAGRDTLNAPERLYPTGIGNGTYPAGVTYGLGYNVADRYPLTSISPLGVMDGHLHNMTRNGTSVQTFTVDLPREVMTSIAAKNDTIHLHLNGTQDFYGAFHMVAGGGSYPDSNYRAKLIVVYSKLGN
jgi:Domain of unknown function (DUF4270)